MMSAQGKVYRASRLDEALSQIKAELGPEAVILSTRSLSAQRHGRAKVEVRALPPGSIPAIPGERAASRGDRLRLRLERAGVPSAMAERLISALIAEHGVEPASFGLAREALEVTLRRELSFSGSIMHSSSRIVALVGPTGAGKTTTIAKVAAMAALTERRRVALISTDEYRVAGAEQLQRYADLIGIPMDTAYDERSLEAALRRFAHADLVLVDTPGRAPRARRAFAQLGDCLHGAGEPVEVHLCVPAATNERELRMTIEAHEPLRVARLLITKLDEAVLHGTILAAQELTGLPLSHFTTGQHVPEDIEEATAERVAALLCGEEIGI
ncbi:MAG: hypothetical protein OEY14_00315 [Myxococcales bacterium]|nr:hypothetical protein [Myxococcales bacterium]